MHSLKHIQAFLFLHGKNVSKDAVDEFLSILHSDIKSGRITKAKDSYHKEVDRIQRSLVGMSNAMWPGEVVKVEIEAPRKKHYESCLSCQGLGNLSIMIAGAISSLTSHHIQKIFKPKKSLSGVSKELKKGIKVEKEHTSTLKKLKKGKISVKKAIEETAKTHIKEDKKYYSKMKKAGLSGKKSDKKGYDKAYNKFYKELMNNHSSPSDFLKKHDKWIKENAPKYGVSLSGISGTKKIRKVMREFKAGKLHSGSKKGPIVKKVKQAKAIALSEQRKSENLGTISATVDEVLANMRSERKGIKNTSKQNTHVLPAAQKVEKIVLETPSNTVTETSINTNEKVVSIQPVNSLGAISAAEMGKMTFTKIKFNDYYKGIFGEPATNFDMCIDGSPGAGKTTFLLKFANHLADFHGPTLFVTTEEFGSATLIDKIQKFDITSKNLAFAKKVPSFDELKKYKYVFIDSINHARITIEQYQQMREAAPNTAFILVLQQTKSGTYKGGTDWPHEVEITMSLRKNEFGERYLNITKDRYTEPVPRQVTI